MGQIPNPRRTRSQPQAPSTHRAEARTQVGNTPKPAATHDVDAVPQARLRHRYERGRIKTRPRCGGKLRVIASIEDPDVIAKVLKHIRAQKEALPSQPQTPQPRANRANRAKIRTSSRSLQRPARRKLASRIRNPTPNSPCRPVSRRQYTRMSRITCPKDTSTRRIQRLDTRRFARKLL